MDFLPGEKVSGKIEQVKSDGLVILLRDDIRGFVDRESLENWDKEELNSGKEVYVVIKENGGDDYVQLELDQLLTEEEKLDEKSEPSLKNLNVNKQNNSSQVSEGEDKELQKWIKKTDKKLEEVRKHRTDRLDEDFYQD